MTTRTQEEERDGRTTFLFFIHPQNVLESFLSSFFSIVWLLALPSAPFPAPDEKRSENGRRALVAPSFQQFGRRGGMRGSERAREKGEKKIEAQEEGEM